MPTFERRDGALSGLRVLELADEKGAYCGKLLADMGADVIKIEPPGGDRTRRIGPFYHDEPHPDRSLFFWHYNTSKRGITLDIEQRKGQALLRRLTATADVLLETYPPGYLACLGLAHQELSQLNPRLVMTSITNFGQTGPYRNWKSSDLVALALGGMTYVCGYPESPPITAFGNQALHTASHFGAIGTLLALHARDQTGRGQQVDVGLHEAVAAVIEHVFSFYLYQNVIPRRQGTLHWNRAFRVFPCQDGHLLLTLNQEWQHLVDWMAEEGTAEDLTDPRYQELPYRRERLDHMIEVLGRWTSTKKVDDFMAEGQLRRLSWGKVCNLDEVMNNPQLEARGFFVAVEHPELGETVTYPGASYLMGKSPWRISRRAPMVGEHNLAVYCDELGLSADDLAALTAQGIA